MPRQESKFLEYIDQRAIARFGGSPMLSQFPMEGSVSGHHKSNHKGSSVEFADLVADDKSAKSLGED